MRFDDASLGLTLDISRAGLDPEALDPAQIAAAFDAMEALESGQIANPDEGRLVGHYWLRAPSLAPPAADGQIGAGEQIRDCWESLQAFAEAIHREGTIQDVLQVGIGGSALGPQLVADALGTRGDRARVHFLDNTDPDGFDRVLGGLDLARTLVIVVSKSGGTKETRNAMLEVRRAYADADVAFAPNAVAITGPGSKLDELARAEGWRARFPIWDWVGGRTSVTSAVGLVPAALQGLDWWGLLQGAAACDAVTRRRDWRQNPAALLALAWWAAAEGRGRRAMVILPYKDRLQLLARYLQQLVMESLGKERDLSGAVVHQGLTVYGNKGSTDQHAYIQQLRDGPDDFFATFVAVLKDREGGSIEVEPGVTSGDYLLGFLLGTRRALTDAGRRSITIALDDVSAPRLGALIALYERAVGLYASLVGINAYHQPGVEAGKRAAAEVLALQAEILAGAPVPAGDDADLIRAHLQANGRL